MDRNMVDLVVDENEEDNKKWFRLKEKTKAASKVRRKKIDPKSTMSNGFILKQDEVTTNFHRHVFIWIFSFSEFRIKSQVLFLSKQKVHDRRKATRKVKL
jgi:hypothetical protein